MILTPFAAGEMSNASLSDASDASARRPPIVVLTGFMASGKTTTGETLAGLLGWEFIDLDSEIEKQQGVAIKLLFQQRGECGFRELEHEALRDCLTRCTNPTVVALGGGAFVQSRNAAVILAHHARTVFLEAPTEDMLLRGGVEGDLHPERARPLATDREAFLRLYEQRLPSYRTASVTIATAGKDIAEVAQEIATRFQLRPCR